MRANIVPKTSFAIAILLISIGFSGIESQANDLKNAVNSSEIHKESQVSTQKGTKKRLKNTNKSATIFWHKIEDGIAYSSIPLPKSDLIKKPKLTILKVDPEKVAFKAIIASAIDNKSRTIKTWAEKNDLIAAINLGMFQADNLSHVGHLSSKTHINNPKWVKKYKSVLAFHPKIKNIPKAIIVDLDDEKEKKLLGKYKTVIQNLRLIKSKGINVWQKSDKKWSEAALAIDNYGKILFIFCKAPFTMHKFNELLLKLPLDIDKAMHLEGGPAASLSIRSKDINLDFAGIYESGLLKLFNGSQQPIPNVLGISKR